MTQYIVIGIMSVFISFLHLTRNPMHEIAFLIQQEKKEKNEKGI